MADASTTTPSSLPGSVADTLAMLGNAVICGVISGPHDRYGARLAWIATATALIAAFRYLADDAPRDISASL